MPFPIRFGTTVTTVLHYRADCDVLKFRKDLSRGRFRVDSESILKKVIFAKQMPSPYRRRPTTETTSNKKMTVKICCTCAVIICLFLWVSRDQSQAIISSVISVLTTFWRHFHDFFSDLLIAAS